MFWLDFGARGKENIANSVVLFLVGTENTVNYNILCSLWYLGGRSLWGRKGDHFLPHRELPNMTTTTTTTTTNTHIRSNSNQKWLHDILGLKKTIATTHANVESMPRCKKSADTFLSVSSSQNFVVWGGEIFPEKMLSCLWRVFFWISRGVPVNDFYASRSWQIGKQAAP